MPLPLDNQSMLGYHVGKQGAYSQIAVCPVRPAMDQVRIGNLIGGGTLSIDDKGRVYMPSSYRMKEKDAFVMTPGVDPCILLWNANDHETLIDKLRRRQAKYGQWDRIMARLFKGEARTVHVDAQGRIPIAQDLREFAGIDLKTDVKVLACLEWIEIWSKAKYQQHQADMLRGTDISQIAESILTDGSVIPPAGDAEGVPGAS